MACRAFLVFSSRQLKWKLDWSWLLQAKSAFSIEEGTGAVIKMELLPAALAWKYLPVSSLHLGPRK